MPPLLDACHLAVHVHGRAVREGRGGDGADQEDVETPTLLLLHGLGDSGACWPDAVRRWGPRYRLLAVDARGHGHSPRFTTVQLGDRPGDVMVSDLVQLLLQLAARGAPPPVLVGHSMGASIAAAAAAAEPDLVSGAVLEDPAWQDGVDRGPGSERVAESLAAVDRARADPAAELARGRAENPSWAEVELGPWVESTTQVDRHFIERGHALPSIPWHETARALQVPTLLVTGTNDVLVDLFARRTLDDIANPHIEVAVVPGAGHCVRRDAAEGYHGVVDPWLAARFASTVLSRTGHRRRPDAPVRRRAR